MAGDVKPGGGAVVPLKYLIPLRLVAGYTFLADALLRSGAWLATNQLAPTMSQLGSTNPYPAYRAFLLGKGQAYSELISYLIVYGEMAIGVCLCLGLFTRVNAAAGTFLLINYLLAMGQVTTLSSPAYMMLVALFTLGVSGAGRSLGLDSRLHSRAPVLPFTLLY
jgi:uncharacterized membrane protein YphA (DoxX/SURF4 family)